MRRLVRADVVAVALGLVAWEAYGRADEDKLTPFTTVVSTAWRMLRDGDLDPVFSTVGLFVVGVGISTVLALVTAGLMSTSRTLAGLVRPYLYVFLAVPPLALVPIFMLLWGPTDTARIVAVVCFSYFGMAVMYAEAVEDAPGELVEMARAYGASPLRVFLRVRLPAVAPRLVAGTRVGVIRGLKGSVTAEVVMAGVGLGGLLRTYSAGFQLPELYATVLVIVVLSIAIYVAVQIVEARIQRRIG
jgi:ABC-type nitrate/sulfonate/bicarbonate transport system permease component